MKGPQGAAKSKSSKKSKKLTQRDDEESDGIEEIEVDSGMQPHFEEEGNEDIQSSFKSDLTPNSNEADDIEESNIDRRTPNGSLKHVVAVSISHTKKRSNSLSRESRRVPPSRRLQTAAYKLEKTQKSPRKSALSNNKNKTTSTNVTPQVLLLPLLFANSSFTLNTVIFLAAESAVHRLDRCCR